MKILAIGDFHGSLEKVKQIPVEDADLILLTGDLGKADLMREMHFANVNRKKQGLPEVEYSPKQRKEAFIEAYRSSLEVVRYLSRFAPTYIIFGNVESSNAQTRKESREIGLELPFLADSLAKIKNVRVINNKIVNFNGVRIGGLEYFVDICWVREFKPVPYRKKFEEAMRGSKRARKVLKKFGEVDILLCHQPPYGYLDRVDFKGAPKHWVGKYAGSKIILDYITREQPRYVFCGHIHEGRGNTKIGKSQVYNLGTGYNKLIEL